MTTGTGEPLLHSRDETRRIFGGIGETTLWELDRAGEIKAVRIGHRTFYTAESARAYVQRLRDAAKADASH
jgi:hypothetical protein